MLRQQDSITSWKQLLVFDSKTILTLGLDEQSLLLEGKTYHLPCVILSKRHSVDLIFDKHFLRFTAAFKIFDGNCLEPVTLELGDIALQVEVPFIDIYIVQKKEVMGKEITVYRG